MRSGPSSEKPRELRRRVMLPARLRLGAAWSDACILNVSSRGLMIHSGRPIAKGAEVEIRRGDHVIAARVIWREGGRAGLRCDDRLPIEEIVTAGQAGAFQLTAAGGERRQKLRIVGESRLRGRTMEFAAVVAIAICLAGGAAMMIETAFARPLARVSAALTPLDQASAVSR